MPFLTPAQTPTATRCRRLLIPDHIDWLTVINGALVVLLNESNWEQLDGITPAEAVQAAQDLFLAYQISDCEPEEPVPMRIVGTILPYATSAAPAGMLPCDGATYLTEDFPDLAAALDPAFLISPTQFRVPDLRGRTVVGAGAGAGLTSRAVGDSGGAESHELTVGQMPAHGHNVIDPGHAHGVTDPGHSHSVPSRNNAANDGTSIPRNNLNTNPNGTNTTLPAVTNITIQSAGTGITLGMSGNGIPHNNMQPFVALRYAIVATP